MGTLIPTDLEGMKERNEMTERTGDKKRRKTRIAGQSRIRPVLGIFGSSAWPFILLGVLELDKERQCLWESYTMCV